MKRLILAVALVVLAAGAAGADNRPGRDAEAQREVIKSTDKGNPGGYLLEDGFEAHDRGDYALAREVFLIYSTKNTRSAGAQFYLGVMASNGQGQGKNPEEAVKWYRKAAVQGYTEAQRELGLMYANGVGVARNEAEADNWLGKAAEQGDWRAKAELDRVAEEAKKNGLVVASYTQERHKREECVRYVRSAREMNKSVAVRSWKYAAECGNAEGQNNLGEAYAEGLGGLKKDAAEAVEWFRKAAEQGNAEGQYNLGLAYDRGSGVANDDAEAGRWWMLAAAQGHEKAAEQAAGWADGTNKMAAQIIDKGLFHGRDVNNWFGDCQARGWGSCEALTESWTQADAKRPVRSGGWQHRPHVEGCGCPSR